MLKTTWIQIKHTQKITLKDNFASVSKSILHHKVDINVANLHSRTSY